MNSNETRLDPTPENKRLVLGEDMERWRNTLYKAKMSYRVRELIGDPPETLKAFEGEVERCLKALDAYATILQELDAEERAGKAAKEQQAIEALASRNGHKEPVVEQG